MQRLRFSVLASVMLAAASIAISAMAKDESNGPPPPEGGPQGGQHGPRGAGGFHLLPRFVADDLKLTDDQKKQVADLEKDTKAKLYKILTADQKKTLEKARGPRMGPGGPGGGQGRGRRGPGRGNGGPDGEGQGPGSGGSNDNGAGGGPKPDRT